MSCTTVADMQITRGNNYPPMIWQFLSSENPDVLFDLAGSTMKLRVTWPGSSLTRSTGVDGDLVIDYEDSTLTWNYTTTNSREMPLGRLSSYEVERWFGGTQQSLVRGFVTVLRGDNPD